MYASLTLPTDGVSGTWASSRPTTENTSGSCHPRRCAGPRVVSHGPERVPVCRRLDLVSHVAAAQSAPPLILDPNATLDQPLATYAAHLPSLSARALRRGDLRWEPDAVVPLVRICGGGAPRGASLLRHDLGLLVKGWVGALPPIPVGRPCHCPLPWTRCEGHFTSTATIISGTRVRLPPPPPT